MTCDGCKKKIDLRKGAVMTCCHVCDQSVTLHHECLETFGYSTQEPGFHDPIVHVWRHRTCAVKMRLV